MIGRWRWVQYITQHLVPGGTTGHAGALQGPPQEALLLGLLGDSWHLSLQSKAAFHHLPITIAMTMPSTACKEHVQETTSVPCCVKEAMKPAVTQPCSFARVMNE